MSRHFPEIVPRTKWQQKHRNVQVGDICHLRHSSRFSKPSYRLCRITSVDPDEDEVVRSCTVELRPGARGSLVPERTTTYLQGVFPWLFNVWGSSFPWRSSRRSGPQQMPWRRKASRSPSSVKLFILIKDAILYLTYLHFSVKHVFIAPGSYHAHSHALPIRNSGPRLFWQLLTTTARLHNCTTARLHNSTTAQLQ